MAPGPAAAWMVPSVQLAGQCQERPPLTRKSRALQTACHQPSTWGCGWEPQGKEPRPPPSKEAHEALPRGLGRACCPAQDQVLLMAQTAGGTSPEVRQTWSACPRLGDEEEGVWDTPG